MTKLLQPRALEMVYLSNLYVLVSHFFLIFWIQSTDRFSEISEDFMVIKIQLAGCVVRQYPWKLKVETDKSQDTVQAPIGLVRSLKTSWLSRSNLLDV